MVGEVAGRRAAAVRLGFVALTVFAAATILWVRQTPDALLSVESFSGAMLQVGFWAGPSLLLYLWKARTAGLIVSEGTSVNYQGDRAKERAKNVPMQRVGDPTEIADVIGFLCSHDARYVSGQVIYIDGGVTAGRTSL